MIDLIVRESWLVIKRNFLLELNKFKISESEAYIITIIPKEGINATLIPSLLGLAPGSASRSLTNLGNKGIIERRDDVDDKRLTKIFLTQEGIAKRKIVKSIILEYRTFLSNKIGIKKLELAENALLDLIKVTKIKIKKSGSRI